MSTTTGQRPMRADARRNYERLLAEAKASFLEHGADASLEEIARRAGVGIGTLYRHFPTRLALQEAVYRVEMDELAAKAYELAETAPPEEGLAAWILTISQYSRKKRGLTQTLKAVIDLQSETFIRCHEDIEQAAETVLTRAQEAGTARPDLRPCDVLRLAHALSVASERAPEDTELLLSFMMDGLRPRS
ncbi:TetR/AcrR family transcriptional regulator [Actinoallomurus rhizosphaericola]|uniref:TetR/AcrR family transcriptional regulator n=1 Tax=Actinoallomurus rhizosphaericola TaxID=2952536 RepID=UPI002093FD52|nr:TetR/AcrR family transcriptional regulator [Actinoallomurus rhizosphaericola]MCO5998286.1 TetR/AcrR family transcriptional regulator [Actinoallomurus rhizosphaericola]